MSVYDLSYEMSALLSSEERSEMHKTAVEQQRQAVQFYLDKYADPKLSLNLTLYGAAMKRMQFVKKLKKSIRPRCEIY